MLGVEPPFPLKAEKIFFRKACSAEGMSEKKLKELLEEIAEEERTAFCSVVLTEYRAEIQRVLDGARAAPFC